MTAAQKIEPIIALGTMTFGGQTSAADADRMLKMFLDEGYNWVDTAFMYTEGKSETILGKLLRGRLRKNIFLATKAYPDKLAPGKPRGLAPGSIRGQLEISLKRMKLDYVDLFYLHAPDNKTPLEVSLETCHELMQEGKVREIGLSNYASWQVAEAAHICHHNSWKSPIIYQGMYNVLTRNAESECIPACRHFGLDFLAYNPLAGGLLTGKYDNLLRIPGKGRFSGEYYRNRFWKQSYFDAMQSLMPDLRPSDITPTEAAIRWILHHSMSDGLLLGATTISHLRQNLAACRKGPLPKAVIRACNKAWEIAKPACERYFRD